MSDDAHLAPRLSRRSLLKRGLFAALGAAGANGFATAGAPYPSPADAAKLPPEFDAIPRHNRFPRIMQDHTVARVREAARHADARRAALRSKADAEAHVRDVRERVRQCLGPWPEKTPLNARTTGALDRGPYSIEKVLFESRPGFIVTANLYMPAAAHGRKSPGVVVACGHFHEGKAAEPYQAVAQALARLGCVALIFDPLGQGERLQYPDANLQSRLGPGTDEHLQAGNQQVLVGESLASWRTWDGIRALDYLLTRPEVDPARVGITGNSGGGTDTAWLCGADPRWTMAAPQCFVTTYLRNAENELPADPEQCPPRVLALGLDLSDFIAAMAPKPVVLLGQEKDFFDVRGLEESYARLKRLYGLLGAPGNIELVISPDYHSYSKPSREALYRWFNRAAGLGADPREPELTLERPENLLCTPKGQVSELGAQTIHGFTAAKSRALDQARRTLSAPGLKDAVRSALRMPGPGGPPEYRILRPERGHKFPKRHASPFAVETEPGVFAIVYGLGDDPVLSRPRGNSRRVLLYVCHQSSADELGADGWLAQLIANEPDSALFTCDPRGIGESRPNTCNKDYRRPYGSDYFYAAHGLMLDRPYVGQKTYDVLRVLQWLKAAGHGPVHLVAAGWGTLPATFAALLSDDVTEVTLRHAPVSYAAIAETEDYEWPLSTFVPGVLATFDLPDCYRALAAKQLTQVEPWDARARSV